MNPSSDAAARTADMMARFLGSDMMAGIADEDVSGIALNPIDGAVRCDTRSRRRLVTRNHPTSTRVLQFVDAAVPHIGATRTSDQPCSRASRRGCSSAAHVSGTSFPVISGPAVVICVSASVVYALGEHMERRTITLQQQDVLGRGVLERWNILVLAGTGTENSTLVSPLLWEIADLFPGDRSVLLETTIEHHPQLVES